jgi:hypothetical protein
MRLFGGRGDNETLLFDVPLSTPQLLRKSVGSTGGQKWRQEMWMCGKMQERSDDDNNEERGRKEGMELMMMVNRKREWWAMGAGCARVWEVVHTKGSALIGTASNAAAVPLPTNDSTTAHYWMPLNLFSSPSKSLEPSAIFRQS